jgi:hypothetical protein
MDWRCGFMLAKKVLYRLSHISSPFCSGYFRNGGLTNYLPGLAFSPHPFNLSLPSSSRITGVRNQNPGTTVS